MYLYEIYGYSGVHVYLADIFPLNPNSFSIPIPYTILLYASEGTVLKKIGLNATPPIVSTRSKMFIYQWTLINDKALHEIAYLWCRLSSLSTLADPSRSSIGGSFLPSFPRPLLRSFPLPSFFIHPTGHASFGHVSFLLLTGQVLSRRVGEERYSEPLADREDSGNKNTRGSKHSSWGFHGVVITITTPFTTTWTTGLEDLAPSSWPFFLSSRVIFFFTFLPWLKSAFMPHASNPAKRIDSDTRVIANGYQ